MKFIRWAAVVPTVVFVLLVLLFAFFFADPLLKRTIISSGQAVFGAKVEIDSLRIGFRDSSLKIKGLRVANKDATMSNLFEIGEARFDARALPLLEKKVIIDEASIDGIQFGTARKTSGALLLKPKKPGIAAKAAERLWDQVETVSLDKFQDVKAYTDPKTVINPDALQLTAAAKKAQEELPQKMETSKTEFARLNADARAQELKQKIDSISRGSNDAAGILQRVEDAKKVQAELRSLQTDIQAVRTKVQSEVQSAQSLVDQVKKAKEADLQNLKNTLSLPNLDKDSFTRALLGPALARQLERVITLTESAKAHMPAPEQKPPPPQRGKGRIIEFPRAKTLPAFLLITSRLSGLLGHENPLSFGGRLDGVTSNPPLYGKPATLNLQGAQGSRSLNVKALADLTHAISRFGLQAGYNGMAIRDYSLGQPDSLSLVIKEGIGRLQGDIELVGEKLSGQANFQASHLKTTADMSVGGGSPIAQRIQTSMIQSLSRIETLTLQADFSGTAVSPEFKVKSNLGEILSGAVKAAVGAEFEKQEQALRTELDRLADAKIRELSPQVEQLSREFLGPLAGQNQLVDNLLTQVKSQATKGVGSQGTDKARDALKGIFGK